MTQLLSDLPAGTRPLEVGRPVDFLEAALHDTDEPLDCFYATSRNPLPDCRRIIVRGEHYLRHLERDGDDVPTDRAWAYCAPCAIAHATAWGVREATS